MGRRSNIGVVSIGLVAVLGYACPSLLLILSAVPVCVGLYGCVHVYLYRDPTFSFGQSYLFTAFGAFLWFFGSVFQLQENRDSKRVRQAQGSVLLDILKLNRDTEYSKQHRLYTVTNREEFVAVHPVTKYDHYRERIERMANGEKNILTSEEPEYYGVTSGTTGLPSKIPQTPTQGRVAFRYVCLMVSYYFQLIPAKLRSQRVMRLFYNPQSLLSKTPSGVYAGPVSAHPKHQFLIPYDLYTTPPIGFDVSNDAAAHYVHALFGLRHQHVVAIEAVFSSSIFLAFQCIERNWRELVHDVEFGTLNPDIELTPKVRQELLKRLRPMPERAHFLKAEFEKGMTGIAKRVWPRLKTINSIGTGAFLQYTKILEEKHAKGVKLFTPYYVATEGWLGYNCWPFDPPENGRFMLTIKSMFYEFLPLDQAEEQDPKTVFADQVEIGQEYEIVLTSYNGLYRYRIGDVVRILELHNQCPVFQFVGRSTQNLSLVWEKVTEAVLATVVQRVNQQFHDSNEFTRIVDFCACESIHLSQYDYISKEPFYVIFVELQGVTEADHKKLEDELADSFDTFLQQEHGDARGYGYTYYREKGSIFPPQVFALKPGAFQKLRMLMLGTSKASPTQLKIPRVLRRKDLLDCLVANRLPRQTSL